MQKHHHLRPFLAFILLGPLVVGTTTLHAQEADDPRLAFFESKIRPALIEHCYECHSVEAAEKGRKRVAAKGEGRGGRGKGEKTQRI